MYLLMIILTVAFLHGTVCLVILLILSLVLRLSVLLHGSFDLSLFFKLCFLVLLSNYLLCVLLCKHFRVIIDTVITLAV